MKPDVRDRIRWTAGPGFVEHVSSGTKLYSRDEAERVIARHQNTAERSFCGELRSNSPEMIRQLRAAIAAAWPVAQKDAAE